jgi:hypothetical protein
MMRKKRNEMIFETPGRLMPNHLAHLLGVMVSKDLAVYEPAKQSRATLLYWRLPEEWAEVLYEWVCALSPPGLYCAADSSQNPPFLCLLLQGDKHRSIKHDPDVLRDLRSTCAICPFGDPRIVVTQCDIGARQEQPGTAD